MLKIIIVPWEMSLYSFHALIGCVVNVIYLNHKICTHDHEKKQEYTIIMQALGSDSEASLMVMAYSHELRSHLI